MPGDVSAELSLSATFISAFTGGRCQGNQHAVIDAAGLPDMADAQWLSLSRQLSPAIVVVLRTQERGDTGKARFFHNGAEVRWCGSGLLAAAKYLQLAQRAPQSINTEYGTYAIHSHGDRLGFASAAAIDWRAPRHRDFWQRLFGSALVSVQESAETRGYTLVELRNPLAVRQWRPMLSRLRRYSPRALILTAGAPVGAPYDYVMRYFAPQYGNDEDSATGSANALLIRYWARRMHKTQLRGAQVSAQGGRFYGRSLGSTVRLTGHAKIDTVANIRLEPQVVASGL